MNRQEFDALVEGTEVTPPAAYRSKGGTRREYVNTAIFYLERFEREPPEEGRTSLLKAGKRLLLARDELPDGESAITELDHAYHVLGNYAINYAFNGHSNPDLLRVVKASIGKASDAVRETVEG